MRELLDKNPLLFRNISWVASGRAATMSPLEIPTRDPYECAIDLCSRSAPELLIIWGWGATLASEGASKHDARTRMTKLSSYVPASGTSLRLALLSASTRASSHDRPQPRCLALFHSSCDLT